MNDHVASALCSAVADTTAEGRSAEPENGLLAGSRTSGGKNIWKCQIRKCLRNSGFSYISRNGATHRKKLLKSGCGAFCRQRCHDRIDAAQREKIFSEFWQLGNLSTQRQFLANHVRTVETKRKKT